MVPTKALQEASMPTPPKAKTISLPCKWEKLKPSFWSQRHGRTEYRLTFDNGSTFEGPLHSGVVLSEDGKISLRSEPRQRVQFQNGMCRVSYTYHIHIGPGVYTPGSGDIEQMDRTVHGEWVPCAPLLPEGLQSPMELECDCGLSSYSYVAGTLNEVCQWRAKVGNSSL